MAYSPMQSTFSSMFIQPAGSVYVINNPIEVSNVPIGAGLSAVVCPTESLLYLKMYQNGQPMIQSYTLTPYDAKSREHELEGIISDLNKKLNTLEEKLNQMNSVKAEVEPEKTTKGGPFSELI